MKLRRITDKENYVECLPWLKEIPFSDMTYLDCLARCLTGQYQGIEGEIEGARAGIMVYYLYDTDKAFIVALWCRKNLQRFVSLGEIFFRSEGVKTIRCSSVIDVFDTMPGMKKLWTVYERAL
jgi:hypothetical protein